MKMSLRTILRPVATAVLVAVLPIFALNPQPLPPSPPGLDVLIGL
jgi:hypothetical protein